LGSKIGQISPALLAVDNFERLNNVCDAAEINDFLKIGTLLNNTFTATYRQFNELAESVQLFNNAGKIAVREERTDFVGQSLKIKTVS
jgi:hypothetical protein